MADCPSFERLLALVVGYAHVLVGSVGPTLAVIQVVRRVLAEWLGIHLLGVEPLIVFVGLMLLLSA